MATQMIPFEYLALAKESALAHGTAVTPPSHYTNLNGTVVPQKEYYEPEETSGLLAPRTRTKVTRKWATFNGEGPLDLYTLPLFLHGIAKGGTITPVKPEEATLTRIWTFKPSMNADNLDTFTFYFGDPNMPKVLQSAYGIFETLTISNDATSTDGATISIDGVGKFPVQVNPPTMPSALFGPLLIGLNMDVYIDTVSAIGTTKMVNKIISVEHTIDGALQPVYRAAGAAAAPTYGKHSLRKRGMTTSIVMEVDGLTEYALTEADNVQAKVRVVHNGPLIEETYYSSVTVDTYGQLRLSDWGDESNMRTMQIDILSEYNADAGTDWQIIVQNDRATL